MPSQTGADLGVEGAYRGTVGGIPATATGSMDGKRIDAILDMPEVAPDRVRAIAPELPLQRPVAAHAEGHGPLRALALTAHLGAGRSALDIHGTASLDGALAANVHLDAKDINLRAFSPTASASDVTVAVDARAKADSERLFAGDYVIAVAPGYVAGQTLPAGSFRGAFEQTPKGVRVDTKSSVIALPRALGARGHVAVEGQVELELATPTAIDAHAKVALEGADLPGVHLDAATVDVSAAGELTDPHTTATVAMRGLSAHGYAFPAATVSIIGNLSASGPGGHAARRPGQDERPPATTVGLVGSPFAEATAVDLWRGREALHAHVNRLAAEGGGVDVEGLLLAGAGDPMRATLRLRPGLLSVKADTNGIDLGPLGRVLSVETLLRKGRLSFVMNLAARRDGVTGTAVVDADGVCAAGVDGLSGTWTPACEDAPCRGRSTPGPTGSARCRSTPCGWSSPAVARSRRLRGAVPPATSSCEARSTCRRPWSSFHPTSGQSRTSRASSRWRVASGVRRPPTPSRT